MLGDKHAGSHGMFAGRRKTLAPILAEGKFVQVAFLPPKPGQHVCLTGGNGFVATRNGDTGKGKARLHL